MRIIGSLEVSNLTPSPFSPSAIIFHRLIVILPKLHLRAKSSIDWTKIQLLVPKFSGLHQNSVTCAKIQRITPKFCRLHQNSAVIHQHSIGPTKTSQIKSLSVDYTKVAKWNIHLDWSGSGDSVCWIFCICTRVFVYLCICIFLYLCIWFVYLCKQQLVHSRVIRLRRVSR